MARKLTVDRGDCSPRPPAEPGVQISRTGLPPATFTVLARRWGEEPLGKAGQTSCAGSDGTIELYFAGPVFELPSARHTGY